MIQHVQTGNSPPPLAQPRIQDSAAHHSHVTCLSGYRFGSKIRLKDGRIPTHSIHAGQTVDMLVQIQDAVGAA